MVFNCFCFKCFNNKKCFATVLIKSKTNTYVCFVEERRGTSRGFVLWIVFVEERRGTSRGHVWICFVEERRGAFLWIVFVEERRGTSRRLFNNIQVSRNMLWDFQNALIYVCLLSFYLFLFIYNYLNCFSFIFNCFLLFWAFWYWFRLKCMNVNDFRDFALHSWLRPNFRIGAGVRVCASVCECNKSCFHVKHDTAKTPVILRIMRIVLIIIAI